MRCSENCARVYTPHRLLTRLSVRPCFPREEGRVRHPRKGRKPLRLYPRSIIRSTWLICQEKNETRSGGFMSAGRPGGHRSGAHAHVLAEGPRKVGIVGEAALPGHLAEGLAGEKLLSGQHVPPAQHITINAAVGIAYKFMAEGEPAEAEAGGGILQAEGPGAVRADVGDNLPAGGWGSPGGAWQRFGSGRPAARS